MARERQHQRFSKKDLATAGLVVAAVAGGISLIREGESLLQQGTNEENPSHKEEFQPYYLTVPVEADAFPSLFHPVQRGDTLWSLSQSWGVPVEQIVAVNGIRDPDRIYVGQLLRMLPPTNSENVIIRPVGFVGSQEEPTQFVINGFDYYFQRRADLSFEGTYYKPGELDSTPSHQHGLAHFYGIGKDAESLNETTSSGQPYDPKKLTCASWFHPIGSVVEVSYNGRSVECLVNDRGPNRLYRYPNGETKNVIIDLSVASAREIEPNAGVGSNQIGEMRVWVRLVSLPENWEEISLHLPTELEQ